MKDYFTNDEFQRCDPPYKKSDMKPDFMRMLNNAREYAGVPFVLTSAYRTVEHEHKMGRPGTSSHTKGVAIDIKTPTPRIKFKVLQGLMRAGFNRIFAYKTFMHVDSDKDKDPSVFDIK